MATTTATFYFRPSLADTTSATRNTTADFAIPFRTTSGLFGIGSPDGISNLKNLKSLFPPQVTPLVDDKGQMTSAWYRFFSYIVNTVLGGPNSPTLPDVTQFVTTSQVQSIAATTLTSLLAQQVNNNASVLTATVGAVQAASLPGASQIPPPQVFIQEPGGGDAP